MTVINDPKAVFLGRMAPDYLNDEMHIRSFASFVIEGDIVSVAPRFYGDRLVLECDVILQGEPIGRRNYGAVTACLREASEGLPGLVWEGIEGFPDGLTDYVVARSKLAIKKHEDWFVEFISRAVDLFRLEVTAVVEQYARKAAALHVLSNSAVVFEIDTQRSAMRTETTEITD